jgi:hypothetical protein
MALVRPLKVVTPAGSKSYVSVSQWTLSAQAGGKA